MASPKLITSLFQRGLGEYLVLRVTEKACVLGQIVLEKNKLILRDRGFLRDSTPAQLGPCWEIGIMGALCDIPGQEWESLTFLGPSHCIFQEDLSSTRYGIMKASKNQYNERLLDFRGSVYRGFQLMLDNNFLPVILLQEMKLERGGVGLTVTNLRAAAISLGTLSAVHEEIRKILEPNLIYDVEDVELDDQAFAKMFPGFKDS